MSESNKVNLASLLNKSNNNNEKKTIDNSLKKDENTENQKLNTQENNDNQSINKNNNENIIKDVDYVISMTTLNKEEVENLSPEQFQEVLQIIDKTLKEKENKLKQSGPVLKTEEQKQIEKDEVKEELGELFTNYKSDFKKEEKSIFKNIREKRLKIQAKIRMPKTRIGLLLSLLVITAMIISSLFIFFPKQHSFSIYKTSIINIKDKYISGTLVNKEIEIDGYVFNTYIQKGLFETKYKYKSNTFKTEGELNTFLKNEVKLGKELVTKQEAERLKKLKKEKIKEALDKKYNK